MTNELLGTGAGDWELWPPPGGYIERMIRAQVRTIDAIENLAKEVDRLSIEHLECFALDSAIIMLRKFGSPNYEAVTFGVALSVIRFFMGAEWVDGHLVAADPDVALKYQGGRSYLGSESLENQESNFKYQCRVTQLAECLYNLQAVPGIKRRVALLRNDDLESVLGEFVCAKLVAHSSLNMCFVEPIGHKGADYDCELIAPEGRIIGCGGRVVCCEIKTKKENTKYKDSSIYNTLEKARKQLPREKPGIIFLTVPTEWIVKADFKAIVDAAIAKVFRQSNRVVAIVIAWEAWRQIGGARGMEFRYQPFFNTRSAQYASDIERIFDKAGPLRNEEWLSCQRFVMAILPDLVGFATSLMASVGSNPAQHPA